MSKTMPPGPLRTYIIDEILIEYANHPSVEAIRETKIDNKTFTFKEVGVDQVYKLLKTIYDTKSTGEDKIPPKYVKASVDLLAEPFTRVINECKGMLFPKQSQSFISFAVIQKSSNNN